MIAENDNLTRSFVWKKDEYETKCTSTIELYKRRQDWSMYLIFNTVL